MTDHDEPRNAGHDAPSTPWQSGKEIRPDLAAGNPDTDTTPQENAAGNARERNRRPDGDVAVAGAGSGGTDQGQEANSVSEPG